VEVERVGLTEVVDAYGRLRRGGVRGRLVAVPGMDATAEAARQ
jgi:hypothetical protein